MKIILDKTMHSQTLLKPEMRLPYQTVAFVYKALDMAEHQIENQFEEIERLMLENKRLENLLKRDGKRD